MVVERTKRGRDFGDATCLRTSSTTSTVYIPYILHPLNHQHFVGKYSSRAVSWYVNGIHRPEEAKCSFFAGRCRCHFPSGNSQRRPSRSFEPPDTTQNSNIPPERDIILHSTSTCRTQQRRHPASMQIISTRLPPISQPRAQHPIAVDNRLRHDVSKSHRSSNLTQRKPRSLILHYIFLCARTRKTTCSPIPLLVRSARNYRTF